jgi:purine-binding chemotaxis protein CheW
MNNLPSENQLPNLGLNQRSLKLTIFSVGKLNLALSVDIVKKVINYTPIYGSGLNHMGVARVDDREITVVDLHKRLFNVSQPLPSGSQGYLVIARNSIGETFGILVAQPPTLQDVSMSQIRALPASYRHADTLEVVSHVTVISQKDQSLTVFILDVDRLVPPVANFITSSSQLSFPLQ